MSWEREPLKDKNLHPDTIKFMKLYETWLEGEDANALILRVDKQIKSLHYLWETEYGLTEMWDSFEDWVNWMEENFKGDYEDAKGKE